jgi:hypothetical protein
MGYNRDICREVAMESRKMSIIMCKLLCQSALVIVSVGAMGVYGKRVLKQRNYMKNVLQPGHESGKRKEMALKDVVLVDRQTLEDDYATVYDAAHLAEHTE